MSNVIDPPEEVLHDIMVKFVCNLGPELLQNPVQLMFNVERAWWYYEDTARRENPNMRHYASYKTFTSMLVDRVPLFKNLLGNVKAAFEEFKNFKSKIPVCGAILMDTNMERVLLVRGHSANSDWGFPRGKINEGEPDIECACREVLEETGLDITSMVDPDAYIEAKDGNGKIHKLFIVSGLDPETAAFAPQLEYEIGAYGWHWLHELPMTRDEADRAYIASGGKHHRFYMVQPFVGRLRSWVSQKRRALGMPPAKWETGKQRGNNNEKNNKLAGQHPQQTSNANANLLAPSNQPRLTQTTRADVGPMQQPTLLLKQPQAQPAYAVTAGVSVNELRKATDMTSRPNLVMSSEFRFDKEAILQSLLMA